MKSMIFLILVPGLLFLCACRSNPGAPSASAEITPSAKPLQEEESLITDLEAESLSFVDVFGEVHEFTVNPTVSASLYNKNIFLRVGFRGYGEEGNIRLDEKFHKNIQAAQFAGLDVGVYFFAQAVNEQEALEEAHFVLEQLEGYHLQLPVVYDPENILHTDSRTDDVSGEQFTKNTIAFCETIQEAGYMPMIYCNLMWQAFQLDLSQLEEYPLWYADYEPAPQTPYHFDIWQYSENGIVNGIDGPVDLNIQLIPQ